MPSLRQEMLGSLQSGYLETLGSTLARSLSSVAVKRDALSNTKGNINDFKTAFSSWDNCMQATFCKWPVIAVIIVGGLFIFSIVWCIIRCACCGLSCCCGCFSCLKCCGNCCGCCDPPKGAKHKYLDDPFIPPHQGYRNEAPMAAPFPPASSASTAAPPQYAEFDMARKGEEDALPQMPSWDTAGSKRMPLQGGSVEMDQLKSPTAGPQQPLLHGASSMSNSPILMGRPSPNPSTRGPYSPAASPHDYRNDSSFSQADRSQVFNSSRDSNRMSDGFGLDEPYDVTPDGASAHPASSHPPYDSRPTPTRDGYGDMHPSRQHPPQGPWGGAPAGYGVRRQPVGDGGSLTGRGAYDQDPRMRNSPGPASQGFPPPRNMTVIPGSRESPRNQFSEPLSPVSRRSPAPPNGFDRRQPPYQRSGPPERLTNRAQTSSSGRISQRDHVDRTYSPGPIHHPGQQNPPSHQHHPRGQMQDRAYRQPPDNNFSPGPYRPPPGPAPMVRHPVQMDQPDSPLTNNAGFDFISGHTRPAQVNTAQSSPTSETYPGYRPYRPT